MLVSRFLLSDKDCQIHGNLWKFAVELDPWIQENRQTNTCNMTREVVSHQHRAPSTQFPLINKIIKKKFAQEAHHLFFLDK